MRIAIYLPSEDQIATAGVRIRYNRLIPPLKAAGHEVRILQIDSFRNTDEKPADICLFCKCHDARSLIVASRLRDLGVQVGIDLFDDYFSQTENSRFVHLRGWLEAIASKLTFAICSTRRMRAVIQSLAPELPTHVVNDPLDRLNVGAIADAIEMNAERARRTRILDIAWFGIGDNPNFPVGLHDLAAYAGDLREARRLGYQPKLTVITNRRALDTERLELVSRLGIPVRVEEWREEIERNLIRSSLLCFLPVNAQSFSVAKSLNRAVTTITAGSQVLSAGFPLYADLGAFVYRDLGSLLRDLEANTLAVRRQTLPALADAVADWADPEIEADRLASFLDSRDPVLPTEKPRQLAVIHGRRSHGSIHKLAQRLGQLSFDSPLHGGALNTDLRIVPATSDHPAGIYLSSQAEAQLRPEFRDRLGPTEIVGKRILRMLPLADFPDVESLLPPHLDWRSLAADIAAYQATMDAMLTITSRLFVDLDVFVSELESPLRRAVAAPASPHLDAA